MKPSQLNTFLFLKLPLAWLAGIRVKSINHSDCTVSITHRWINQNPFQSLYFAAQAMAAELTTGALVMWHIKKSGQKFSMLVTQNNAAFHKKAKGNIKFTCHKGTSIATAIETAINTNQPQKIWLSSEGKNSSEVVVSSFNFEWSIKKT